MDLELQGGGCLVALVVTSCIADWFRHSSMCLLKIRLSAATLRQHTGQVAVEPCTNREEPLGKLVTVLHPGWVNDVITITRATVSVCTLICTTGIALMWL